MAAYLCLLNITIVDIKNSIFDIKNVIADIKNLIVDIKNSYPGNE